MANLQIVLDAFIASYKNNETYPLNLLRKDDFPYALSEYYNRLEENQTTVFRPGRTDIVLWDLPNSLSGR